MPTSNLRIIAVGIAVIFAVLTGLFTGMAGGGNVCAGVDRPPTQAPGDSQEASPGTGRRGGPPGIGEKSPVATAPAQGTDQDADPQPGGGMPQNPGGGADGEVQVEVDEVEPVAVSRDSCGGGGFSVLAALVGFLGALLAAGAVVALSFASRVAPAVAAAAPAGPAPRDHVDADRSTLVQACIYVRDRATSKALADRLGWALQEAGVTTVAPTGVRFDPAHHEAGGSVATDDPAKVGTIAAVEVPGYVDRGHVLRVPVVTVYRQDGQ